MKVQDLIIRSQGAPGFFLCQCKLCGKRGTGRAIACHIRKYHLGAEMYYRNIDCPKCGCYRIQSDGVCENCLWDVDNNNWAPITRPNKYDSRGRLVKLPGGEGDFFSGTE